jgi:hypothetical protein
MVNLCCINKNKGGFSKQERLAGAPDTTYQANYHKPSLPATTYVPST